MSYVSTLVYCETTIQEKTPQGEKAHIVNPMHLLVPLYLPGQFSFTIFFGIVEIDATKKHRLRIVFSSPEGKPVVTTDDIEIDPPDEPTGLPKEFQGFMGSIDFRNVLFELEGKYNSEIFMDDESLGTFPIMVRGQNDANNR